MRLAALYHHGSTTSSLHLETTDGYVNVDALASRAGREDLAGLSDVGELFRAGSDAISALADLDPSAVAAVPATEARLAPPVRRPSKIVCVGLNYAAHIAESGLARPERIVLFAKFASCLIGDGEAIVRPAITDQLDYEGELAVVIGRPARGVSAADALSYVGGYTIINDVSARDLQRAEAQWIRGKALDTFAPLGPVVVDAASAPSVDEMHIRTLVNGDVRQDASCSLMITRVPELIEHISAWITLEPGDLIATGTPSGVALGMEHPLYMLPGDTVRVEIDGIGALTNRVTAP